MAELLESAASWPSLLLVLFVFGFAPGFCLRLIVLAYPRSDPRRTELIAELYIVPRIQRPLWVAEQLEVALFEGLAHRVSAVRRARQRRARAKTGRVMRFALVGWLVASLVTWLVSGLVGGLVGGLMGLLLGLLVGGLVGWLRVPSRWERVLKL